ncbi:hypothetical protein ZWY2020_031270 [Hordeum vulgare]|nr:hypothetical protein ZWY2020_031270 [Hordeum vulgare]
MHPGRKYDSGASKRRKKHKLEEDARSQKGALDIFVVKEPQPNSKNQISDANIVDADGGDPVEIEAHIAQIDEGDDTNNVDEDDSNHLDEGDTANIFVEGDDANIDDNINNLVQPDIFDPRIRDALDPTMIDILVQKGPKRYLSIEHGPIDKFGRRFSALSYTRVLSNGEKCDREWLVYNKDLDKVFCFCRKLLRKGHVRGQLANYGFSDWHHIISRLKEHENVAHQELEKEREHWRKVLLRILLIVKFLAEDNIAFRGSNSKVYQDTNGNFLGLVQMLAEFDPVIKEHVDRITNDKIHDHYLGPSIQNELISLLATAIKSEIIRKVKEAKYFSILLDCTPNASHQEQTSLIIRYVDASSGSFCIEESLLGFWM